MTFHAPLCPVQAHLEEDKTFVLLDDDDDDEDDKEDNDVDDFLEEDTETDIHDVAGYIITNPCLLTTCWGNICTTLTQTTSVRLSFSVENAYIDEKEDACDALGEIAFNTG